MNSGIALRCSSWIAGALLVAAANGALAQPKVPPIGGGRFAGVIALSVDATDLTHKVFHVTQQIPLQGAGLVTLLYPQWQGASHAPTGQVGRVAGLVASSHGQPVAWTRDPADPFAFHLSPPPGAKTLEVAFTYLSPRAGNLAMTRHIVNVGWSSLLLYPAGYAAPRITVQAQLRLPAGMDFATSLDLQSRDGDVLRFKPASLDTLVDSPLLAGHHARSLPLSDRPAQPVTLSVFANRPEDLAVDAARMQPQPSRAWKPLRDSVHDPITLSGRGIEWPDFTGKKDYYVDGALLWLAVDVEIRARTAGRKGIDDFVRLFFAPRQAAPAAVHTFTEADLYAALNRVSPGDWKRFFDERLDARDGTALLSALERGGYRLVYTDEPTETYRQDALDRGVDDYVFSLGMAVGKAGLLRAVNWDGPAFRAGLTVGARLLRVNGQPYDAPGLKAAVASGKPVELEADLEGERIAVRIESNPSLRYPRLVPVLPGPSAIDAIFTRPSAAR